MEQSKRAQTCSELLKDFDKRQTGIKGKRIRFINVGDRDVYNITAPFDVDGEKVIAGRVERRDTEYSKVIFFVNRGDDWTPLENAPVFDLQDPFIKKINDEILFGGVEVFPDEERPGYLKWKTLFYRGKSIYDLKLFAESPVGMKDVRLVGLPDGKVGVFTRPQGKIGGRGKIGFTVIDSLDDLNTEVMEKASLIENQFVDEEWGGANELHILKNGKIGVLGHIACFDDEENRHYHSMTFVFDPATRQASPLKIIAVRKNFEDGEFKRNDLIDVVLSGGLVRRDDGYAELYVGVSDAEAHMIVIPDPFLEYETEESR